MSAALALLAQQPTPQPEPPNAGLSSALGMVLIIVFLAGALLLAHLFQKVRQFLSAWRQRIGIGALIAPALPIAAWFGGWAVPWWVLMVSLLLSAWIVYRKFGRASSVVSRWGQSNRRKSGVASFWDIWSAASWYKLRRKARVLRPTLTAQMNYRELLHTPLTEFGDPIARVGLLRIWHACEDFGLIFGGPRTGKTQWLEGKILDASGACLVTSTRTDLLDDTGPMCATKGPVEVFNAGGLGGRASTITFDPLVGCEDPTTAQERATDLLAPSASNDGDDRSYWNDQARRILAAMMHAAALASEFTMDDVARWVADPKGNEKEILWQLRRSSMPGYATEIRQFIGTNERTRTSITTTMMPALAWLVSPSAREASARHSTINVERLLATRTTVYMLGAKDGLTSALVSAFTGYIAREARRIAATMPGGRLDPNLTLVLDEAALCAPPLEDWTADMGGRNVTMYASFQSRAQLLSRWSDGQAAEILNNAATILLFGGTNDKDDLTFWSTRAGDRDEPLEVKEANGGIKTRTVRSAPVLAPAQLANLPEGKVVIFRRGMPPVVATAPMAYKRRDVRTHHGRTLACRIARLRARYAAHATARVPVPPPLHSVPDDDQQRPAA